MKSLSEIDQRFNTSYAHNLATQPFAEYFKYVSEQLSPVLKGFEVIMEQYSSIDTAKTHNLMDVSLLGKFIDQDYNAATNIIIYTTTDNFNKIKKSLPVEDVGYMEYELMQFNAIQHKHLLFLLTNMPGLLKYIEYNNYLHRGGDYITYAEYKQQNP